MQIYVHGSIHTEALVNTVMVCYLLGDWANYTAVRSRMAVRDYCKRRYSSYCCRIIVRLLDESDNNQAL